MKFKGFWKDIEFLEVDKINDVYYSRLIGENIDKVIDEGYPLASIQIISSLNKFKSELTLEEEKRTMDVEQKDIFDFLLNTISTIEQDQTKN